MKILNNQNIAQYNTFKINTSVKKLIIIESYKDLVSCYKDKIFNQKFFILGGGSDVLFINDLYDGCVIKIELKGIKIQQDNNEFVIIEAFAGVDWDDLINFCINNNYGGMENLSLIPGSVGGSAVQNIGAYGLEAKDFICSVEYFNLEDGKFNNLNFDECEFYYRGSIFKNRLLNKAIVTKVSFKLKKNYIKNLSYPDILSEINSSNLNKENITAFELRNIICKVRKNKIPYPNEVGNAGSFFKNPLISNEIFQKKLKKYPDIKVTYINEKIKVSAGWLIEKAGWKGWIDVNKNYGVSEKHALVIVNYANSKGKEIYELSQKIKEDIRNKFEIILEEEVVLVI